MAPIPPSNPCSASTPMAPNHATAVIAPPEPSTSANADADADADADASLRDALSPDPGPRKRKRKDAHKEKQTHGLFQTTFRKTAWSYLHLVLVTPSALTRTSSSSSSSPSPSPSPSQPELSPLVIAPLLTSALRAYLGTTGAAIPVDILKTVGRNVWIRVPRQDAKGVRAALSSWVGSVEGDDVFGGGSGEGGRVGVAWRVVGCEGVLGLLLGGGEGDGEGCRWG